MQPDGEGVIINKANQVSLIRNLEGDLRKPWLHLSGHQHIMDAIGQTSWSPIRTQIGLCTSGRIIHRDCGAVRLWQLLWFVRAEGHHLLQSTSWRESHPTDEWFHLGPDTYGDQESNAHQSSWRHHTDLWYVHLEEPAHLGLPFVYGHQRHASGSTSWSIHRTHQGHCASCWAQHRVECITFWRMTSRKASLICAADTKSASIDPRIRTSPGSEDPMDIGHTSWITSKRPWRIIRHQLRNIPVFHLIWWRKTSRWRRTTNLYQLQPSTSCEAIWEWHQVLWMTSKKECHRNQISIGEI